MSTVSPNLGLNIPNSDGNEVFDYTKFIISNFNILDALDIHQLGGNSIQPLATPTVPTITAVGTTGTTTYSYYIVAKDKNGNTTMPSPVATVTNGNSQLTPTNYNTITWSAVPGASSYDILKGDTGHSLVTNLKALTYNDTGQTTNGYTAPTRNTTGDFTLSGLVNLPAVTWNSLTLQNGWVYYGSGAVPAYRKDIAGNVWVRGLIKNGTTSAGTILTQLPVGFRPASSSRYFFAMDGNLTMRRIQVNTDGTIALSDSGSSNVFQYIEPIMFPAEQ